MLIMLPDISNRITNIIKAIEKTITPAIDPENGMAQEQAALSIGHLKMLEQQWNYAYIYEKGSFDNMLALASELNRVATGGAATINAQNALSFALKSLPTELPLTPLEINEHTKALGEAVDGLIHACYEDANSEMKQTLFDTILSYSSKQSSRERVWFSANNLDPDSSDLVSMEEMLFTPIYNFRT